MDRIQGTVKWVNLDKGFAFLTAVDASEIYCDFQDVQFPPGGSQTLSVDQLVEFELTQGPNGPQAVNVIPL